MLNQTGRQNRVKEVKNTSISILLPQIDCESEEESTITTNAKKKVIGLSVIFESIQRKNVGEIDSAKTNKRAKF